MRKLWPYLLFGCLLLFSLYSAYATPSNYNHTILGVSLPPAYDDITLSGSLALLDWKYSDGASFPCSGGSPYREADIAAVIVQDDGGTGFRHFGYDPDDNWFHLETSIFGLTTDGAVLPHPLPSMDGTVPPVDFDRWRFGADASDDGKIAFSFRHPLSGTIEYYEQYVDVALEKSLSPVPEPAAILLLGFGLVGIAAYSRKKIKR